MGPAPTADVSAPAWRDKALESHFGKTSCRLFDLLLGYITKYLLRYEESVCGDRFLCYVNISPQTHSAGDDENALTNSASMLIT
jgi:hypothetical protein